MNDRRRTPPDHPIDMWPDLMVNTTGRSIRNDLDRWMHALVPAWRGATVTFVAGYVSVRGLLSLVPLLRELINGGARIRLLLGVAPNEQVWMATPRVEPTYEPAQLPPLLKQAERDLIAEIDGIPFTSVECLALLELCHLLQNEQVLCRRYERGFLHGKATILTTRNNISSATAGSANMTLGGLLKNQELMCEVDRAHAAQVASVTDHWWDKAADFALDALIERRFTLWPHPLVYLRMLREVYGAEVDRPVMLPLRDWQKEGVAKGLAIIDRIGGVLIADDVGLGKTYEGGEIVRYARDNAWGRVLVVCPAHLRDTWQTKLTEWDLGAQVISYNKLNMIVEDFRELDRWPQFGLVICDEAHCLRNPTAKFASSLRELITHQQQPFRRVLMTATPVNNYGRDLYELLTLVDLRLEPGWLASGTHTDIRRAGRSSEGERLLDLCEHADELTSHKREDLYRQLDQLVVRRTRQFIKQHYPDAGVDFPTQHCIPLTYTMSTPVRRLMAAVLDAVDATTEQLPDSVATQLHQLRGRKTPMLPLTFAAYELAAYARGTSGMPYPMLIALFRVQLFKRMESSPAALATTVARLIHRTEHTLDDLARGVIRMPSRQCVRHVMRVLREAVRDIDLTDQFDLDVVDTEADRLLDEDVHELKIDQFDAQRLRTELQHDAEVLRHLRHLARDAIKHDTKRDALVKLLVRLAKDPRAPKIVIFASSRVTTTDLGRWLTKKVDFDDRLALYRGRIASLGDAEPPSRHEVNRIIAEFAPATAGDTHASIDAARLRDRYDLLIGTDILAEGLNLQQAALLVHYDLPWNPQTLGQRAGRLDRIGSHHTDVDCYTMLPDEALDLIINLLDRLRHKAALAAATIGQPTMLFPDCPVEPRDFATALARQTKSHRSKLYVSDQHRAWLAQALRIPAVCQALDTIPAGVGALTTHASGHTFCFSAPGKSAEHIRARLCHIHNGLRAGATISDALRCLAAAHTPLTQWFKKVKAGYDPTSDIHAIPHEALAELWGQLHRARVHLAGSLGVPTDEAVDELPLVTWIGPHQRE